MLIIMNGMNNLESPIMYFWRGDWRILHY